MKKKRRGYRWRVADPKVGYNKSITGTTFPPDSKIDCLPDEEYEIYKKEKDRLNYLYFGGDNL